MREPHYRALDAVEASLFQDRHPDIKQEKNLLDSTPRAAIEAGTGGLTNNSLDLAFPWGDGRAVFDSLFHGYVLVWRDATQHWHFIDMSDDPEVAVQFNNAPYVSPDASFLQNALDETYKRLGQVADLLAWVPWIIGGLVVLEGLRAFKR